MQQKLSLSSLGSLDLGVVTEAFDLELKRIVLDIKDRPAVALPRRLSINFVIKPTDPAHGDTASVECEVVSSVPKRVTRPYEMRVKGDDLSFQSEDAENPDQLSLEDERKRNQK